MPELSRFYGIVISMYHNDHNPPHFHVRYGGSTALVGIAPITILRGHLPASVRRRVMLWAREHQDELSTAWNQARRGEEPGRIAPLR